MQEKQVAVAVGNVGPRGQKLLGCTSVEGRSVQISQGFLGRALHEKKVFPVREKIGITIRELAIVFMAWSRFLGCPAAVRHTLERTSNIRREEDDAALAPSAPSSFEGVAKRFYRSAGGLDFSKLTIGKKAEISSVRRPEGEFGALGARQGLGLCHAEPLNKKKVCLLVLRCNKHDLLPIRREHRRTLENSGKIKARGPLELCPNQRLRRSQPVRVHRRRDQRTRGQHPSQDCRSGERLLPVLSFGDHHPRTASLAA